MVGQIVQSDAQRRRAEFSDPSETPARLEAPEVSDATVQALVADMDRTGVAVLPDFVSPADLRDLQEFVERAVEEAGGEYVGFNGRDAVAGTLLAALADSPRFQSFIRRVYEGGARRPAPSQSIYQVLRCLKGETGARQAFIFHFDSYVVTMLLPILIPSTGKQGHLLVAPNLRKERPLYVINLVDKILLDNKLTQALLRRAHDWGLWKFKKVKMVPGNLYLFWGYRSLHTNEACDVENIRSTALYHFGDPHADSPLRQKMGRAVV
ncbi:hypothetical protein [Phenylobacterium sp.]|jgi:hypothetical protein|uniref:hypothetical protein n=1 Tax=Phenylobacterium sp. TaxID=1871053 RepID=UPI002F414A00